MLPFHNMMFLGSILAKGQMIYTTPGTYTFVTPPNVFNLSVVGIGGGGSGNRRVGATQAGGGGGGGGLAYLSNLKTFPGEQFTVEVGAGGIYTTVSSAGGSTKFGTVLEASGGAGGSAAGGGAGGSAVTGTGGGTGGTGGNIDSVTTTTPESVEWSTYQYNTPPTAPHWTLKSSGPAQLRWGSYLSPEFDRNATIFNRSGTNERYQRGTSQGNNQGDVYYSLRQGIVTPESSETVYYGGGGGGTAGYTGNGGAGGRGRNGGTSAPAGGNGGSGATNTSGNGANGIGTSLINYGGPAPLVGFGGGSRTNGGNGGLRIIWGKDRSYPNTNTGDV